MDKFRVRHFPQVDGGVADKLCDTPYDGVILASSNESVDGVSASTLSHCVPRGSILIIEFVNRGSQVRGSRFRPCSTPLTLPIHVVPYQQRANTVLKTTGGVLSFDKNSPPFWIRARDPLIISQGIPFSCLNSPRLCFSKESCVLYIPPAPTKLRQIRC